MAVTSNDIGNAALQRMGDNQSPVTGQNPTWDSSAAGVALQKLYTFCVQAVQRRYSWDASRRLIALVPSGNPGPYPFGFTGEFIYPANGIELWQVQPLVPIDLNDPLPANHQVGNTLIVGVQTKVVWTSEPTPYVVYNNNPSENTWDPGFREAVITMLAAELADAIAGRPETATGLMQMSNQAAGLNQTRDG